MKETEKDIQTKIRLELSRFGIVLRLNSGRAYGGTRVWDNKYGYILKDIRPIALCVKGTPDLLFIGPDGTVAFIECKDDKGRLRSEQEKFINVMRSYGHKAGVARSVEQALEIIGYGS